MEELAALFRVGSRELAGAPFTDGPVDGQKKLLKMLTQEQAAALLNALPPDDRPALLNELPLDGAMQMGRCSRPTSGRWRRRCSRIRCKALGLILGGIGFLRIAVWSMFSTVYGPHWLRVRGRSAGARRYRAGGLADGFDAAARAQAPGLRPRDIERPVRGDAR